MSRVLEAFTLAGFLSISPSMPVSITDTGNQIRSLTNDVLEIEPKSLSLQEHQKLLHENQQYQESVLRIRLETFRLADLVYQLHGAAMERITEPDAHSDKRYAESYELMNVLPMEFLAHNVLSSPHDFTLAEWKQQFAQLQVLEVELRTFLEQATAIDASQNNKSLIAYIERIAAATAPHTADWHAKYPSLYACIEELRSIAEAALEPTLLTKEHLIHRTEQLTASEREIDALFTLLTVERERLLKVSRAFGGFLPGARRLLDANFKTEYILSKGCGLPEPSENGECLSKIMLDGALQFNHNSDFWFQNPDFDSEYFYISFLSAQAEQYGYLELAARISALLK